LYHKQHSSAALLLGTSKNQ